MEMSIKEKVFMGAIASTIILAIGGSAWAFFGPSQTAVEGKDTSSVEGSSPIDTPVEQAPNERVTDSTANKDKSTASEQIADAAATPIPSPRSQISPQITTSRNQKQPTSSNNSSNTTRAYPQKMPCNESTKASYTILYNSQTSAENARWANKVNSFNNQATGDGASFSGSAQNKINQYKPAHNATITSINDNYQSNLASINCQ